MKKKSKQKLVNIQYIQCMYFEEKTPPFDFDKIFSGTQSIERRNVHGVVRSFQCEHVDV